jgi:pre-mRNA-splicing factor ATP-dependent RNA helicase DHX16
MNSEMTKFARDLEEIKKRRKQVEDEVKKAGGPEHEKLSKKEKKELKTLLKEKDKLERDALVARMKEKDSENLKLKIGSIVENPLTASNITAEDKMKYIPELRQTSRQEYLEKRGE